MLMGAVPCPQDTEPIHTMYIHAMHNAFPCIHVYIYLEVYTVHSTLAKKVHIGKKESTRTPYKTQGQNIHIN